MPYVILAQPDPDLPVFEVQKEDGQGRKRLLHRNFHLPFISLPIEDIGSATSSEANSDIESAEQVTDCDDSEAVSVSDHANSDSSSSSGSRAPRYRPPHRRQPGETGLLPRRTSRQRKPSRVITCGDFVVGQQRGSVTAIGARH
ncbi:hypothetical protein DPMN_053539 [Dreissena polymorpha]|uniref:Uncharacterized protein n=1 Tax=Dreissena polymorpha TaxID=45954 RepID=A0A9D4HQT4_DREPO|nr:hypothetical protein DPMN_053539 [Dreissena polymorpha]